MSQVINFDKLTNQNDDIFEVVIVAAKRAKQINSLRMAKNPLPTLGEEAEETFEETPEEEVFVDFENEEKPLTLSIQEIMDNKVNYRYSTPATAAQSHDDAAE